jgi:hypothetical protein
LWGLLFLNASGSVPMRGSLARCFKGMLSSERLVVAGTGSDNGLNMATIART